MIVGPLGHIIVAGGEDEEIVPTEIDPGRVDSVRKDYRYEPGEIHAGGRPE